MATKRVTRVLADEAWNLDELAEEAERLVEQDERHGADGTVEGYERARIRSIIGQIRRVSQPHARRSDLHDYVYGVAQHLLRTNGIDRNVLGSLRRNGHMFEQELPQLCKTRKKATAAQGSDPQTAA